MTVTLTPGILLLSGVGDVKDEAGRVDAMVPPNGISPQFNSILRGPRVFDIHIHGGQN